MSVVGGIITIPLVFFLPGFFLCRSRLFASRGLSWIEKALLPVVLSVSFASLTALLMAELGFLRVWLLDLVLAAVAVLVRILFGWSGSSAVVKRPGRWEIAGVAFLVLLSLVVFFRPADYVMGEGDPEYYVNIGGQLAATGDMSAYDEYVPEMSQEELESLYFRGIAQFLPFHLRDRTTGRIQPLMYHLLPVWIGLFMMLFGTGAGLFVLPVFALLGMLALYALARRLAGPGAAFVGAALSSVFFLQVWFARVPNSEVFCAFFLLSAVLFFLAFREDRGTVAALGCALAATAASTARPEAAVVVLPLMAVMGADLFRRIYRRGDYVLVNSLILGVVYLLVYIRLFEFEYVSSNFGKVVKLFGDRATMNTVVIAVAAVAGACLLLYNLRPLNRRLERMGTAISGYVAGWKGGRGAVLSLLARAAIALGTLAVFVFSYWFAPGNADIFKKSASFFGGALVFLFVAGLCLMVLEMESLAGSFTIAVTTVVLTVAAQDPTLALGQYPWDARRIMSFVAPMLFVGFAYLFKRAWGGFGPVLSRLWGRKKVELRTVAVAVSAGVFLVFCAFDAPIIGHVEYRGGRAGLEQLAEELQGDAVLFTDWYEGELVGMPLRYIYDVDARKVFRMDESFAETVERYEKEGKRVLVEMGGVESGQVERAGALDERLECREAFTWEITVPRLQPSESGRPTEKFDQTVELDFHECRTRE